MGDILQKLSVDDWGRMVATYDQAVEVLLSGRDLHLFEIEDSAALQRYNEMCRAFDKAHEVIAPSRPLGQTPAEYHADRSQRWLVERDDATLWDQLLARCRTTRETERFIFELEEFNRRGLLPMLVQLKGMIDDLDRAGVVRGLGRGSSVASFILYLMEVHFINPLDYDLELSEFLK